MYGPGRDRKAERFDKVRREMDMSGAPRIPRQFLLLQTASLGLLQEIFRRPPG